MERAVFTAGTSTVPASAVFVRQEPYDEQPGDIRGYLPDIRVSGLLSGTCLYPDMQAEAVTCYDIRCMTKYSVSWDNAVTGLPMVRHILVCCQMQDCGSRNPADIIGT